MDGQQVLLVDNHLVEIGHSANLRQRSSSFFRKERGAGSVLGYWDAMMVCEDTSVCQGALVHIRSIRMTIVVKTAVFWQQRAMTCGTCSCDRAGQDSLRDPGETIYLHAEPLRMISAIRRKMPMLLAPRRIAATTSWVARCL